MDDETYEAFDPDDTLRQRRRDAMKSCDRPEEILAAAYVIAEALKIDVPCEVSIAPGNGTRYAMLFARADRSVTYVSPREYLESSGVGESGGVWIGTLNGRTTIYPLALMGRERPPAPSYLAEKWFPGRPHDSEDVFVFEQLLWHVGRLTAAVPA